jgi:hypothetical protein
MIRHTTRKARRRQEWMATYQTQLTTARPQLTGKVDWDTATYLFNQGMTAQAAAEKMAASTADESTDSDKLLRANLAADRANNPR